MSEKRLSVFALVTENPGLDTPVLPRQMSIAHSFWHFCLKQPMFALNQIRRHYLSKPCQKRQGTERCVLEIEVCTSREALSSRYKMYGMFACMQHTQSGLPT